MLRTFFFPLLELAAAKALASFEACTFGACTNNLGQSSILITAVSPAGSDRLAARHTQSRDLTMMQGNGLAL